MNVKNLASTSFPFTLTTVQVSNLALTHKKWIIVHPSLASHARREWPGTLVDPCLHSGLNCYSSALEFVASEVKTVASVKSFAFKEYTFFGVRISNYLVRGQVSPQYRLTGLNWLLEYYLQFVFSFSGTILRTTFKGAQAWDIRSLGFSWFLHHKVSMCGRLRG